MKTIDERVLSLKMNNQQFESAVASTVKSLAKLQSSLELSPASFSGLKDLDATAKSIDFSSVANGLQYAEPKVSAFSKIATGALMTVGGMATVAGASIVKNVLGPIVSGGKKRAANLEQAKFQLKMLGADTEAIMANVNYAVSGTAYGLDTAAKVAAQFAASGMTAGEDMQKALRGISGAAAMTNSTYEDMGDIFTKINGQGRVMGDDLNRLGARGLNAAAILAKSFGVTEEELRSMVSRGEVSFNQFAAAMDDAFGEKSQMANETLSGAMSNLRSSLGRIGAEFFMPFNEATRKVVITLIPFFNAIKTSLLPVFSLLGIVMDQTAVRIGNVITKITAIYSALTTHGPKDALGAFAVAFEQLQGVFDRIVVLAFQIKELFTNIFVGLKGRVDAFVLPITQVATQFKDVIKKATGLTQIEGIFDRLGRSVTQFKDNVKSTITNFFAPLLPWSREFASEDSIAEWAARSAPTVESLTELLAKVLPTFESVRDGINAFADDAGRSLGKLYNSIKDALPESVKTFGARFETLQKVLGDSKLGQAGAAAKEQLLQSLGDYSSFEVLVGSAYYSVADTMNRASAKIMDLYFDAAKKVELAKSAFKGFTSNYQRIQDILSAADATPDSIFRDEWLDSQLAGFGKFEVWIGKSVRPVMKQLEGVFLGANTPIEGFFKGFKSRMSESILLTDKIQNAQSKSTKLLYAQEFEKFSKFEQTLASVIGSVKREFNQLANLGGFEYLKSKLSLFGPETALALAGVMDKISKAGTDFISSIQSFFNSIFKPTLFKEIDVETGKIVTAAGDFPVRIIENVSGMFKTISEFISSVLAPNVARFSEMLGSLLSDAFRFLTTVAFPALGNILSEAGSSLWTGAKASFSWILGDFIPGVVAVGKTAFAIFGKLLSMIQEGFASLSDGGLAPIVEKLGSIFKGILAAGFLKVLSDLLKTLRETKGSFKVVGFEIQGLAGVFKGLQQDLQAKALLKIAGAIGILALSFMLVAQVDAEGLKNASIGITVLVGELVAIMLAASKLSSSVDAAKMAALGTALSLMSITILAMATAVYLLGTMDVPQLVAGLAALSVTLGVIAGFVKVIDGLDKNFTMKDVIVFAGFALALRLFAGSISSLGEIPTGTLVKGIGAMTVSLFALAAVADMLDAKGNDFVKFTIALGILSGSILLFASALILLSTLDLAKAALGLSVSIIMLSTLTLVANELSTSGNDMLKGAIAIGILSGSLVLLAGSLYLIGNMDVVALAKGVGVITIFMGEMALLAKFTNNKDLAETATYLQTMAGILGVLTASLRILGEMDIPSLAKGTVAITALLGVLTGLSILLSNKAGGAATVTTPLLGLATAVLILSGALVVLSAVPFGTLMGSVAAVSILIGVFVTSLLLLSGVAASIIVVGAAFALLGAGIMAIGAGLSLFVKGIIALTVAAPLLAAGLSATLAILALALPAVMEILLSSLLNAFDSLLDSIVALARRIILEFLDLLIELVPLIVDTGIKLLIALLQGIRDNIYEVTILAVEIVAEFLSAVAAELPKLLDSGADLIISFISGVAETIRTRKDELKEAAIDLGKAVIEGLVDGLKDVGGLIKRKIRETSDNVIDWFKETFEINSPSKRMLPIGQGVNEGLALYIDKFSGLSERAVVRLADGTVSTLADSLDSAIRSQSDLFDLSPTITPVLDMSQMDFNKLDTLLADKTYDLASGKQLSKFNDISQNGSSVSGVTNVYETNYQQNNYSPKALSPLEIYRNTQKQIKELQKKGAPA